MDGGGVRPCLAYCPDREIVLTISSYSYVRISETVVVTASVR